MSIKHHFNAYLSYNLVLLSYHLKLTRARLKKGTVQSFRFDNLARIFVNLSWYDSIINHYELPWLP